MFKIYSLHTKISIIANVTAVDEVLSPHSDKNFKGTVVHQKL